MISYKPDFIKVWYIASRSLPAEKTYPVVAHIAQLTHKNKLKLAVHATDLETARLAVKAGADILVHSVRDKKVDREYVRFGDKYPNVIAIYEVENGKISKVTFLR